MHKSAVPPPKPTDALPKLFVAAFLVLGLGAVGYQLLPGSHKLFAAQRIVVPQNLTARAQAGKIAFETNCAPCHGLNGGGTDHGPPFVNVIYNPGHHGDASFFAAVRRGVVHHHWNFGDMPAQPQIGEAEVARIIAYVRALQEANGIVYQPHNM